MSFHPDTFNYLKPTDEQVNKMQTVRNAALDFAKIIAIELPDGPDKTYVQRKIREVAMWANVAITRQPDGAPRY